MLIFETDDFKIIHKLGKNQFSLIWAVITFIGADNIQIDFGAEVIADSAYVLGIKTGGNILESPLAQGIFRLCFFVFIFLILPPVILSTGISVSNKKHAE